MKKILLAISMIVLFCTQSFAKDLEYKVHRADEDGFNLASVLITGKKDAVLIDAHFTKADAYKVVAQILDSGKELKTIYVSHGDPDYYFGLPVIKQAFPNAKVYASKATVEHIVKTYNSKLEFWGNELGNAIENYIVLPEILKGDTIKLEEKDIKIIGLKGKQKDRTYVYVPSIKAIFGGINITSSEHLWMADTQTKEQRLSWLKALEDMSKLDVKIVVATHGKHGLKNDTSSIEFTKKYLIKFEKELKKAKNSQELIKAMQKAYPNLKDDSFSLDLGAKVLMGEQKW